VNANAGRSSLERVNVVTNINNNNVINAIINNTFTEQCIVDTGAYLSFLDNDFVILHKLPVTPMRPGSANVFIAAGETKIRAVRDSEGSWSILLRNFRFTIISPSYQSLGTSARL